MSAKILRYTPAYDNKIWRKYSVKTLKNKVDNKLAMQKELGFKADKKLLLAGITTDLLDKNGCNLLFESLEGVIKIGIQLVVKAAGSTEYHKFFDKMSEEHPKLIGILPDNDENKRKIYAASDIIFILSNNLHTAEELKNAFSYGTVPVCCKMQDTLNYDPVQEKGNAFVFEDSNKWDFFASLARAQETYRFPYDWRNIMRKGMEKNE